MNKLQETNLVLAINGEFQVLAYEDDVNLIGDDIRTKDRNAVVLLNVCEDIDLTEITRKIKYMEVGPHPGMMANEQITIISNSQEKLKNF